MGESLGQTDCLLQASVNLPGVGWGSFTCKFAFECTNLCHHINGSSTIWLPLFNSDLQAACSSVSPAWVLVCPWQIPASKQKPSTQSLEKQYTCCRHFCNAIASEGTPMKYFRSNHACSACSLLVAHRSLPVTQQNHSRQKILEELPSQKRPS